MGQYAAMRSVWMALACLFVACGGADQGSSRGVAEHYANAMDQGDPEMAFTVIVPGEKLREAFDCGPRDSLGRRLQRAREDLRPSFESFAQTGMRLRMSAFAAESQSLAIGDQWQGCTARMAIEVQRAQVTLSYRKGARDAEETERWDFLRFGAETRWWLMPH